MNAWCSLFSLFPGLNPDDYDAFSSGWPDALRPLAAEARRRADAGQLTEEQLYPSDAAWAGLFDLLASHTPAETARGA